MSAAPAGTVAIVGTGLVGRGWSIVLARAGYRVRMFDTQRDACRRAVAEIGERLRDLQRYELVDDPAPIAARLEPAGSLGEAVDGVDLVQECVLETVDAKRAVFADLDAAAPRTAILASSSSAIPASTFTEGLAGRERCLVGHPANPPYLLPIVEVVPAPWTSPEVVERAVGLYRAVGQEPVVVRREVPGFIINRLQGALLNEAFALVDDGYIDVEGVDKTIAFGLGLRWSFMGPFETIDLNAPGGVRDYAQRYAPFYYDLARRRSEPQPWSDDLIARIEAERRTALAADELERRSVWRDRRLMMLAAHMRRAARELDGENARGADTALSDDAP